MESLKETSGKRGNETGVAWLVALVVTSFVSVVAVSGINFFQEKGPKEKIKINLESLVKKDAIFFDSERTIGALSNYDVYTTIKTAEGEYALVSIIEATVENDEFRGLSTLEMPNGELIAGNYGSFIEEITLKDGRETSAEIVDKVVGIFRLKDGNFIPIKIVNGSIEERRIVSGTFSGRTFDSGYQIAALIENKKIASGYLLPTTSYISPSSRIAARIAITETNLKYNPLKYLNNVLAAEAEAEGKTSVSGEVLAANIDDPRKAMSFEGQIVVPKREAGTYEVLGEEAAVKLETIRELVATTVTAVITPSAELVPVIESSALGTGNVTSTHLKDLTILGGDIADEAITSVKIANGTIVNRDIADGAINSAKIEDGTVTTSDIKDATITSTDIASNTIDAGNLAATLTFSAGDFVDLSAVTYSTTSQQGLLLPNASSATPSNPSTGEGYLAWDTSGNTVIVYDGSSWTQIGGTITLYAGSGETTTTSSASGMELINTDELSLIRGCGANQLLKWDETNKIWQCASDNTGAGGASLDSLTAAVANSTTQDSNAFTLNWNWDFTTPAIDSGLNISESSASTLGNQDQQALVEITTLTGSTASPLQITNASTDAGDVFIDLTNAGDFEVRDAGTAFATFADNGSVTLTGNITANDAGADSIVLGAAADTVTITSNSLSLTDDNWSIGIGGAASFTTVTASTSVTSPTHTGTGAVEVSSGGTSALTLNSASGTVTIAAGDAVGNGTWSISSTGLGTSLTANDLSCTNCIGPTEISDLTLGTDTAGNYVATGASGNGVSLTGGGSEGATLTADLGALTANWNQTGAFDISLNNTNSEIQILESGTTPTLFGILDVGDLSGSSATYTFSGASGTVLTSVNYGTTLDTVYAPIGANFVTVTANGTLTGETGIDTLTTAISTTNTLNVDSTSTLNAVTLDAGANLTTTAGAGSLVINSTVTSAGDKVIEIVPSYTGEATDLLTYSIVDIAAFTATNAAGTDTVKGISIGNLTEVGAPAITSTAITIGTGWDTAISIGSGSLTSSLATLVINAAGAVNIQDNLDVDGTLTAGSGGIVLTDATGNLQAGAYAAASIDGDDLASGIAGNGLVLTAASPDTLDIDLLGVQDGTGSVFSFSGMEFQGASSDKLTLLQGCTDGQILKWDDEVGGNGRWDCAADTGGGGGTWDTIGDAAGAGAIAFGETVQTMDWTLTTANSDYLTFTFTNNGGTAGTDRGVVIKNAASTNATGDVTTEALLVLDQADTNPTADNALTDGLLITNSGGSTFTNAITIGSGTQSIATALNISSTGVTTDIKLQNAETIDNNANGTLVFTGVGGTNNAALTIDFETNANFPILSSSTDTAIGIDEDLTFVDAQTISTSGTGGLTLDSGSGAVLIATGDALQTAISGNPGTPADGMIWYDSTAGKYKIREGGTIKTLCNATDAACGAGSGAAWSALQVPTTNLSLAMDQDTTSFDWISLGALNPWTFALANNSTTATTQNMVTLKNSAVGTSTDLNTETLLLLDNADTGVTSETKVDDAIKVTVSGGIAGGITDAIDASDANIDNAISIGANAIAGTNFSVTGAGAVTAVGINSGTGLIQGTGGLQTSGAASSINASSNFNTNINTGTSTGTAAIGNALATVTITSNTLSLTDDNWSIGTGGVGSFATINGLTITANGTNTLNIGAGLTLAVSTASKTLTGAGTQISIANSLTFGSGTTGTITLGTGTDTLALATGGATSLTLPTAGTLITNTASANQTITSTQTSGTVLGVTDSTAITAAVKGQVITLSGTGAFDQTGLEFNLSGATGSNLNDIVGTGGTWKVSKTGVLTVVSCTGCGGGGANWDTIGDPSGAGAIAFGSTVQTMDWGVMDANASFFSFNFTNAGTVAGTDSGVVINNAQKDTASTDTNTENLLLIQQLDTSTGSSIVVDNALKIDSAGNANITDAIEITNSAGNLTNGINIVDTAGGTLTTGILMSGTITTGIDLTDVNIGTGISLAANDITGTTAVINFTNFDIDTAGNITVAAAEGLDTNAAGALELGKTNATSIDFCNSAACDTVNIGNLATVDADSILIGDSTDTVTITSNTLSLTDDNWSIGTAGAASFASVTSSGAIAANGGITFDQGTDTVGAHTITGTLTFNVSAPDITTITDLDLTIAPSGAGDTIFTLDSDTQSKFNYTSTTTATYITGAYGGAATLGVGAAITGVSIDLSTNLTFDAGGNGLTGLLLTVANGGAGTTYGIDIAGAADNGIRIGGAGIDITTGTGESLVIVANGAGTVDIQDATTVDSLTADTGGVLVPAAEGLDTSGAGALELGKANATSIDLCNSANCDTINIGNLATVDADTIIIGDTLDGLTIASTTLNVASGAVSGITTLALTGAISGATATNTINGMIINSGAVSGVTTLSLSSAITGATATNTINGIIINSGAVSGVTTLGASDTVTIGTGGNTFTFNPASGPVYAGTARPTKTINLIPEYSGATLTGDTTSNTGTMTSDFCSDLRGINTAITPTNASPCDSDLSEEHNYYTWTSTSASQDYDIWVRWQVPSDFSGWDTLTNAIQVYGWRTDALNTVTVSMFDTAGAAVGTATNVATGTGQWTQTTVVSTPTGTYTVGGYVTFRIQMANDTANDHVKVGEIEIDYKAKF